MGLEAEWLISFSLLILTPLLVFKIFRWKQAKYKNLPPGPPALPILGHLHLLKEPIYHSLLSLSNKYGPVMLLQLGFRRVLIVTSPAAAEECLSKNDINFANRPRLLIMKHLNYNYTSVGAAPYGLLWRNLRRVTTHEFLSSSHLDDTRILRQDEANLLVDRIMKGCGRGCSRVDLKETFTEYTTNISTMMTMGKRYYGDGENRADPSEAKQLLEMLNGFFDLFKLSNLADFLQFFQWVDIKGTERKMVGLKEKWDAFIDRLVAERRQKLSVIKGAGGSHGSTAKPPLIDRLLALQETEPEFYTQDILRGIVLVMLLAGAETSWIAMEWAMALLLIHPDAMKKVRIEIDVQVGQSRLLEDHDLRKLSYLQNVIAEALRLYPPAPVLAPHETLDDCTVGGYDVPRGTMLIVNAWAIHKDPKVWESPEKFMPERHQGKIASEESSDHQYDWIPFGTGRRSCPGNILANRMIALALGTLIQSFEWERVDGEEIDMTPNPGSVYGKLKPLEAICKPRVQA